MSNTLEQLYTKDGLAQWLGTLTHFMSKDISALPADKLDVSPGGVCRTPKAIIGEVIGLCKYASQTLRGEEQTTEYDNHGDSFVQGMNTPDELVGVFQAATAEFSEAILTAADDIWVKEVMPPWQMKTTVFGVTNIAINHIWYHDGQINTYQCLYGDAKVHWMD